MDTHWNCASCYGNTSSFLWQSCHRNHNFHCSISYLFCSCWSHFHCVCQSTLIDLCHLYSFLVPVVHFHNDGIWSDKTCGIVNFLCWCKYFDVNIVLGFIIGMLVNSIFASIFNIYSVWSLVIFIIVFTIPLGLLSFKFRDQIIIASSSLTGSYFIVRPISWIFGGFPNEFLLY